MNRKNRKEKKIFCSKKLEYLSYKKNWNSKKIQNLKNSVAFILLAFNN